MSPDNDRLRLDEFAADQLRIHQEEIAAIRDELDDRTETYEILDEVVQGISAGIDKGTREWKLTSEDDRDISESGTTVDDCE